MASLLSLVIGILLLVLCGGSDHFDSIVSFVIILFSIVFSLFLQVFPLKREFLLPC